MNLEVLDEALDYLNESYIVNEKDILYNKDKFDSGDINICFIIGLSGSGKSTLAHSKESDKVEAYELDDLLYIADHFTMDQLKEYGDLIHSYFDGPGKRYYITQKYAEDNQIPNTQYEDKLYPGFIEYSKSYAKSHRDKKYIIEGVWIVNYCRPEQFKDTAFYIKGTSLLISKWRAAKRDSQDAENNKEKVKARLKIFTKNWANMKDFEGKLKSWRNYFKKLETKEV